MSTNKSEYNGISNQITKVQSDKKLIALTDKLVLVKPNHYAQIHAETGEGNVPYPSRIGITLLDYTNGTGDKTISLSANIPPASINWLFEIVKSLKLSNTDYEWKQQRIHEKNLDAATGLAPVQTLTVKRQTKAKDGSPQRNPWVIILENGKAKPLKTKTGGTQIDGKTYRREKYAFMMLNEADMFKLLYDAQRFITLWEMSYGIPLIKQGKTAKEQPNTANF